MAKLDETAIIDIFLETLGQPKKPFSRIGDDVAFFPDSRNFLVLKSDMLVGKTDVPKQMNLWQAARKAVIMCASDILVKGAKPLCFMLSLGLPRSYKVADIRSLARGVKISRDELGIEFLGGDTNESDDLIIDCVMLGGSESIVSRGGAKVGDAVYVSGEFGLTAAGLKILNGGLKTNRDFKGRALQSVLMPKLNPELADVIRNKGSASIDSSDGLAISLYQIAEASNVSIELGKIPIAKGLGKFAKANNLSPEELALYGGEEYEMVFCVSKTNSRRVEHECVRRGIEITRIGIVGKGNSVFLKGKRLEKRGWVHLSS